MAATTVTRTISGVPDMRIGLTAASIGRLITIPTTWQKIRVGVVAQWTDKGGNITGTPRFALGLGSGVTKLVGASDCKHFVGVITTAPTWTRSANAYTVGTTAASGCTKIGNVITISTDIIPGGTVGYPYGASTSAANRAMYTADITKGSPNYTFEALWLNSGTSSPDILYAAFLNYMESNEYFPAIGANYQYTSAPQTVAVDEATNGVLDSVQVWWSDNTTTLEICSLAWGILDPLI